LIPFLQKVYSLFRRVGLDFKVRHPVPSLKAWTNFSMKGRRTKNKFSFMKIQYSG